MTLGRLSRRREITPVPSHGSTKCHADASHPGVSSPSRFLNSAEPTNSEPGTG